MVLNTGWNGSIYKLRDLQPVSGQRGYTLHWHCRPVDRVPVGQFNKIVRLVGLLGSGPRLIGRIGSGYGLVPV